MNWQLILIVIILLALAIIGIAVKMFFKKGATFQKHCASKEAGKHDLCVCKRDEKECR
jgi:flagellar basal body-associated protein FliL